MTDVDHGQFQNPNPEQQAGWSPPEPGTEGQVQEKIQHSGDLGLEFPVDHFSKSLDEADREGLVKVPDSVPVLNPTEAPAPPVADKKSRWPKILGGGAAAAVAIGAGAFALGNKSGGDETSINEAPAATAAPNADSPAVTALDAPVIIPSTVAAPVAEATAPTTSTQEAVTPVGPTAEDDGTETDAATAEELADPKNEPVLMTATSVDELAEQYAHNYNCMLNAPSQERQTECLSYMVGNNGMENPGPATVDLKELIGRVNEYRQTYPDYRQSMVISGVYPESEYSDDQATVVMSFNTIHQHGSPGYNGPEEALYVRLSFGRSTANTEDGSASGEQQRVWVLEHTEFFEPGETTVD